MLKARVCETSATGDIEAGQLLRAWSIWSALVVKIRLEIQMAEVVMLRELAQRWWGFVVDLDGWD